MTNPNALQLAAIAVLLAASGLLLGYLMGYASGFAKGLRTPTVCRRCGNVPPFPRDGGGPHAA